MPRYVPGWIPDEAATARFVESLPLGRRTFVEAAPSLVQNDDRDAMVYRAIAKCMKVARLQARNQGSVGSCVGHGTATACDLTTACEIVHHHQAERWPGPCAADAYYALGRDLAGMLGRWDGSHGAAAAKAVRHGSLHMTRYGEHDLTRYSPSRAKQWAWHGVPVSLKNVAAKHPFRAVAQVKRADEARGALQNGYGINVCSSQGFSSKRDADGFAKARGTWMHSMAVIGYRGGRRRGFLIQNSWGDRWIEGSVWPDDQPHGSFWCEWPVMERMLSQRDAFAYSNYDGFVEQRLDPAWAG